MCLCVGRGGGWGALDIVLESIVGVCCVMLWWTSPLSLSLSLLRQMTALSPTHPHVDREQADAKRQPCATWTASRDLSLSLCVCVF